MFEPRRIDVDVGAFERMLGRDYPVRGFAQHAAAARNINSHAVFLGAVWLENLAGVTVRRYIANSAHLAKREDWARKCSS
jgi:hypothetical protein